jgi:hypothetical protein
VKNLVNWQYLLFTETCRHSMLASRFCKIRGEKHPRAFVKVVEGSEIYNFSNHHLVHFYSNIWSFRRSNSGAVSQGRVSRRHAAPRRDVARRARARACAAPTSASEPLAPSRGRTPPRGRARTEALEVRARHVEPSTSPPSVHCFTRRSVAASPTRARRPSVLAVLRCNGRHASRRRLGGAPSPHRLFKRPPPPARG